MGFRKRNTTQATRRQIRNPSPGIRREVENIEDIDEANFEDPVGILSRGEKTRFDNRGSGATLVDVSATSGT